MKFFIPLLKKFIMSFQTFVTERLAALTAMMNAISTNAKKIDELPKQDPLVATSKVHVSKAGISEYLEIQQIINAVLIEKGVIPTLDQVLTAGDTADRKSVV